MNIRRNQGEKMMKIMTTVVLSACALMSTAAQKKGEILPAVTLKGYVVDAMCGDVYAKKKNPLERAKAHTRQCGLEEACSASGYGIVTEKGWVRFDADGNVKAKKAVQASKRTRGLLFEVTGTRNENLFSVTTLKEIEEEDPGAGDQAHEGHKH